MMLSQKGMQYVGVTHKTVDNQILKILSNREDMPAQPEDLASMNAKLRPSHHNITDTHEQLSKAIAWKVTNMTILDVLL